MTLIVLICQNEKQTQHIVWERDTNRIFKKFNIFIKNIFLILDRFDALILKIIKKNIILIYFNIKNTLKNKYNYISKQDYSPNKPGLVSFSFHFFVGSFATCILKNLIHTLLFPNHFLFYI